MVPIWTELLRNQIQVVVGAIAAQDGGSLPSAPWLEANGRLWAECLNSCAFGASPGLFALAMGFEPPTDMGVVFQLAAGGPGQPARVLFEWRLPVHLPTASQGRQEVMSKRLVGVGFMGFIGIVPPVQASKGKTCLRRKSSLRGGRALRFSFFPLLTAVLTWPRFSGRWTCGRGPSPPRIPSREAILMAPIRRGGGSTAGGRWFMTGPKIPKELGNSLYRFASLRGPPQNGGCRVGFP